MLPIPKPQKVYEDQPPSSENTINQPFKPLQHLNQANGMYKLNRDLTVSKYQDQDRLSASEDNSENISASQNRASRSNSKPIAQRVNMSEPKKVQRGYTDNSHASSARILQRPTDVEDDDDSKTENILEQLKNVNGEYKEPRFDNGQMGQTQSPTKTGGSNEEYATAYD